jgi:hypothetical protein
MNFAISDASHESDEGFHDFTTLPNVLTPDKWEHVAAVYDQAAGTRHIYVNGEEVASRTDSPITIFNGGSMVGIGAHPWTETSRSASYFNGQVDEVSFYKVALLRSQIQAIFRAGRQGKCLPN